MIVMKKKAAMIEMKKQAAMMAMKVMKKKAAMKRLRVSQTDTAQIANFAALASPTE